MSEQITPLVGAYGFRFSGATLPSRLLSEAADDWPIVKLTQRVGTPAPTRRHLGSDRAQFDLVGGGYVSIDRRPARGTYLTPEPIPAPALVHPYLVPVAAVHAYWLGHLCFHAGGFVRHGKAWGVLGEKQAGKSTLLASLSVHGLAVLTDDLLVVADQSALAGPRSIDLRRDAAAQIESAEYLGVVGQRKRWRLTVGRVATKAPLAGFVVPAWSRTLSVRHLDPGERLKRLVGKLTVKAPMLDPAAILPLVSLPMIELSRPRAWGAVDESTLTLLAAIDQLG